MNLVTPALLGIMACLGLTAAWLDVSQRRLPNWLCLLTALCGLAAIYATKGLVGLGSAGLHAVLALVVGMILFRFGTIGAGDAKFYAACATWFPLSRALELLFTVSLCGIVLVLAWFAYRQLLRDRRSDAAGKFALLPYGLAIAAGAVTALARGGALA